MTAQVKNTCAIGGILAQGLSLVPQYGNTQKCNNFVITKVNEMEASIIKIGNSKGLRLNKQILEQYQITDKIELILEQDRIIIKPVNEPRKGWDEAFQRMSENNDDDLLIDDVFEDEDFDEWN